MDGVVWYLIKVRNNFTSPYQKVSVLHREFTVILSSRIESILWMNSHISVHKSGNQVMRISRPHTASATEGPSWEWHQPSVEGTISSEVKGR